MVCGAIGCGWAGFWSAPTGHGIPAQGETLGTRHTKPMRSEGTPHRSVGQAAGRGGDGPRDSGPTGRGSGLGLLMEIRARRPACLVGTVSHRPFPGRPGEVGMARETRALPGAAAARWAAKGVGSQTRSSTGAQPRGRLLRWVHQCPHLKPPPPAPAHKAPVPRRPKRLPSPGHRPLLSSSRSESIG